MLPAHRRLAAVSAAISMGFAEALSDNGSLTALAVPLTRGVGCGAWTGLGGWATQYPS
jgi:hypothetical protein